MQTVSRFRVASAEYNHLALGLIFLKYISDTLGERRKAVLAEWGEEAALDHGVA